HRPLELGDALQLLGHHEGLQLPLGLPRRVLPVATTAAVATERDVGQRTRRLHPPGSGRDDLHRVRPAKPPARVLGDLGHHHFAGQGVPHEHHAPLVPGNAMPPVRDGPDLEPQPLSGPVRLLRHLCSFPFELVPSPRRVAPGRVNGLRPSNRSEDSSCHGTLVTITPGWNSRRLFSRSALWSCSSCSHQRPTTYSGMNTVTTSRGESRRIRLT